MLSPIKDFLKLEAASGIILVATAALAMMLANSPLSGFYDLLLNMPLEIRVGPLQLAKPLLLWINDGLMAMFFFLVGLELKREILEGELSDIRNIALPALGALGGMILPASIYAFFNWNNDVAMNGWAIPTATDIAFALGILALLGNRVPPALQIFLVSLAIFDDIGAIIIIAIFYTSNLSLISFLIALFCLIILYLLNRRGIAEFGPYALVGIIMWIAVLKSGVHATLSGVLLAMFIPLRDKNQPDRSPLRELEHDFHTAVAFGILPIFAFANSGITLGHIGLDYLLHPVPIGIGMGLFLGKQIGVFAFCWIGIKLGIAKLPENVTWGNLYGVALICGVGFTMSLFVGSMAFEKTQVDMHFDERLGIIVGSLLSAFSGYVVLNKTLKHNHHS